MYVFTDTMVAFTDMVLHVTLLGGVLMQWFGQLSNLQAFTNTSLTEIYMTTWTKDALHKAQCISLVFIMLVDILTE